MKRDILRDYEGERAELARRRENQWREHFANLPDDLSVEEIRAAKRLFLSRMEAGRALCQEWLGEDPIKPNDVRLTAKQQLDRDLDPFTSGNWRGQGRYMGDKPSNRYDPTGGTYHWTPEPDVPHKPPFTLRRARLQRRGIVRDGLKVAFYAGIGMMFLWAFACWVLIWGQP